MGPLYFCRNGSSASISACAGSRRLHNKSSAYNRSPNSSAKIFAKFFFIISSCFLIVEILNFFHFSVLATWAFNIWNRLFCMTAYIAYAIFKFNHCLYYRKPGTRCQGACESDEQDNRSYRICIFFFDFLLGQFLCPFFSYFLLFYVIVKQRIVNLVYIL